MVSIQGTFFSKMSQDSSTQVPIVISPLYSMRWPNAGQWTLHGGLSMPSTGYLSEDVGCLSSPASHPRLTEVLESDVPPKYFLSPKAAAGVLRRAERRGKDLPETLRLALRLLAGEPSAPEKAEGKTA